MSGPSETLPEVESSTESPEGLKGDAAFISYAREDEEFVRTLHPALAERGHECWVDWRGLHPTAEWMEELKNGIDAARAFIFVISPDSAASEVCSQELKHAESVNKRIIPVVRHEVDRLALPEALAARQWIFFRDRDDFDASLGVLIDALDTDPDWLAQHTRLLVRAREWERNGRDSSFALRGKDLTAAEAWLTSTDTRKQPHPTQLHTEYVIASRRAATRSQRFRMGALAIGLLVALALAGLALAQRNRANHEAEVSRSRELAATSLLGASNPDRALALAVRAGETADTPEAEDALRQAIQASRVRAVLRGQSGTVNAAEFSPDADRLVTAGDDGVARIWNARTGMLLRQLPINDGKLTDASFSPDGASVLVATKNGEKGSVQVWNTADGRRSLRIDPHSGNITSAAYSPDGRRIVTSGQDGTARIWSATTGEVLTRINPHSCGALWTASFSPDGHSIVTAGTDGTARVWDVTSGKPERVLLKAGHHCPASNGIQANSAMYSPNGKEILTATDGGAAQLWDVRTGRLTATFPTSDVTYTAAFNRDGRTVVTSSVNGTAEVWDPAHGPRNRLTGVREARLLTTLRDPSGQLRSAAFSPNGRLVVYAGTDGFTRISDSSTDDSLVTYRERNAVLSVDFSPDGGRLLTTSADGTAAIHDSSHPSTLLTLRGHSSFVWTGEFSQNGREVITSSQDHTARIWDAQSGATLRVLKGHTQPVHSATFSPDANQAVTGGFDHSVREWNARTGTASRILRSNGQDSIYSVSVSPSGDRIASGGTDKVGKIWDADTGEEAVSLKGHTDTINSIAFDSTGTKVVTASEDRTARIWDARSGAPVLTLQGSPAPLLSAAFSPDGNYVATGGVDHIVRVWDAHTGQPLEELHGARGVIRTVSYSPDGQRIAAGSDDRTARIFECRLCMGFHEVLRLGESQLDAVLTPAQQGRYLDVADARN